MASLSQLVTQGAPAALNMVKTLLATPLLINPGVIRDKEGGRDQGMPFAIPLETETNTQSGTAEVSESLIITQNKKKNMTDNVAPGAWTWSLTGFIPGISALEPTNKFTPFVQLNTALLRNAYKQGYILIFKDIDACIYKQVAIQNLTIDPQADCRNKTPFSMTLKEINVMTALSSNKSEKAQSSFPAAGTLAGDALMAGTSLAVGVGTGAISMLIK